MRIIGAGLRMRASGFIGALLAAWLLAGCATSETPAPDRRFTLAVIPDTQNMLDYRHQRAAGFAFDANDLFVAQMAFLAQNARQNGGDIAFVAAVGDVWQHQSQDIDADHSARGHRAVENPFFAMELEVTDKTRAIELPAALAGYRLIDGLIPFGVAPGNHDYDAMWSDASHPPVSVEELGARIAADPGLRPEHRPDLIGMLHIGGLDNFRSVFGAQSDFFRDKPWYVSSYNGGANSAQIFSAGGYTFLHLALEMQPMDDVLDWAAGVMREHPGLPTILSTHDYLSVQGERKPGAILDLKRIDDRHNDAEALWNKLIRNNDQIFLVLCGHQHGQALRIDDNAAGHKVYQVLADYQDRGQSSLDAGVARNFRGQPVPTGDAWLRLMQFDFSGQVAQLRVRTWSPHYGSYSGDLPDYAAWYREHEQPGMSDEEFLAADDYVLELADFRSRFGAPR